MSLLNNIRVNVSLAKHVIDTQFFDILQEPVFIKDRAGRYLWANSFFISRSAGYQSLTDIINKSDTDFPWSQYADELRSNDNAVIETLQSQSYYEQIIRHDNTYLNIITRKSPLIDTNGSPMGVIGFSLPLPQSQQINSLTQREKDCVRLLSQGYTDKQIAKQFMLSPRTVETHLSAAKRKLNVTSRSQLIAYFSRVYPLATK